MQSSREANPRPKSVTVEANRHHKNPGQLPSHVPCESFGTFPVHCRQPGVSGRYVPQPAVGATIGLAVRSMSVPSRYRLTWARMPMRRCTTTRRSQHCGRGARCVLGPCRVIHAIGCGPLIEWAHIAPPSPSLPRPARPRAGAHPTPRRPRNGTASSPPMPPPPLVAGRPGRCCWWAPDTRQH